MTAGGDSEGLRFSPHIYNTCDEIDRAVAAVRELTWISHHWVEPHEYHQNSADKGT